MSRKKVTAEASATAISELLQRIRQIRESARSQAARSVNSALVQANWLIGRQIVEAEQGGVTRAEYGAALLQALSRQLGGEFGSGFSVSALQYMRAFYLAYPELLAIQHAPRVESSTDAEAGWMPGHLHTGLSWTHYRTLLKVERREARDFYEIEGYQFQLPSEEVLRAELRRELDELQGPGAGS